MTREEAEAARAGMMDLVALIQRQEERDGLVDDDAIKTGKLTAEAVLCGLAAGGASLREVEAALILLAKINPYRAACAWLTIQAEVEGRPGWPRLPTIMLLRNEHIDKTTLRRD
jgi:hypothetical protein